MAYRTVRRPARGEAYDATHVTRPSISPHPVAPVPDRPDIRSDRPVLDTGRRIIGNCETNVGSPQLSRRRAGSPELPPTRAESIRRRDPYKPDCRWPRVNIDLPEDVAHQARIAGLNISGMTQRQSEAAWPALRPTAGSTGSMDPRPPTSPTSTCSTRSTIDTTTRVPAQPPTDAVVVHASAVLEALLDTDVGVAVRDRILRLRAACPGTPRHRDPHGAGTTQPLRPGVRRAHRALLELVAASVGPTSSG